VEVLDQQPEQGFRLPRVGGGDNGFEVVGNGGELGRVGRCRGLWGELSGEVGVLLAEGVEARLEGRHACLEALRVQVASLEPGVVAVERPFGAAHLVGEGAALFLERRLRLLRLRGGGIECFADEGAVAVEGGELVDDGGFEFVARDAFAVTGFAAEFLSAGAGVVVVEAAVTARGCADVCAAAAAAADEPGEEVVAPGLLRRSAMSWPRSRSRRCACWKVSSSIRDSCRPGMLSPRQSTRPW
jgi:hypothetical protein